MSKIKEIPSSREAFVMVDKEVEKKIRKKIRKSIKHMNYDCKVEINSYDIKDADNIKQLIKTMLNKKYDVSFNYDTPNNKLILYINWNAGVNGYFTNLRSEVFEKLNIEDFPKCLYE